MQIEHRICRNNLGESDDAAAAQYVDALTAALRAEYPDATVIVNLRSDFANTSQTLVSCPGDYQPILENVDLIANTVWDRMG